MNLKLKRVTDKPVEAIAEAAAESYRKDTEEMGYEDASSLVKHLIERGHMSPIEFASATFSLDDVSRSFLAQLTRHRHASYMVSSQRYNEADERNFVIPNSISGLDGSGGELSGKVIEHVREAKKLYKKLRDNGVPKEDARYIMPIGTTSSIHVSANFREWRHVIEQRGLNDHAQWEIRRFAQSVLKKLHEVAEPVFADLMETYEEDFER